MSEGPKSAELSASDLALRLRAFTPARVGLGRTGVSQQTRDLLDFQRAHAQARDAVQAQMNYAAMQSAIASTLPATDSVGLIRLHSAAPDRATYLQRPDLGRRLDDNSRRALSDTNPAPSELALIISDGLSALAVERHAPALLTELLPRLRGWKLGTVCIVEQARVAIGDEIGFILRADLSVVLIGERPGLSSPDSLGVYITWHPRPGRTDAERSCISNIRTEGLSYRVAAEQLVQCLMKARARRLTGTGLGTSKNLRSGTQQDGGTR